MNDRNKSVVKLHNLAVESKDPGTHSCQSGFLAGFLTPSQLAQQFGISTRTLQRWEALRIGPPRIVVQRKVLYSTQSFLSWLSANENSNSRIIRK